MKKTTISKPIIILTFLLLIIILSGFGSPTELQEANAQGSVDASSANINYVYLAGPFFNEEEIANVEYVESILAEKGLSFFSPMRHEVNAEPGTTEWAYEIFEMDRTEIEKADVVVALYYGSNSDTGTAWECGYASAVGTPIVLIHINEDGDSNLMMHCGCTTNIYLKDLEEYDFQEMPIYEYEGKMY